MTLNYNQLNQARRLLFNVPLVPLQGTRFQPTGFPDLGAATYQAGETDCLLVESAQSMANRLESQIWDENQQELIDACKGLSYVRVEKDGIYLTSSISDAHRLNSPYILEGGDRTFPDRLKKELQALEEGPIDRNLLATVLLRYDCNSLLHGIFLAKKELAGGRLRIARAITACIEAHHIAVAASGGVKNDHVDPSGDASKGFGNVPFHRDEYTAEEIIAYFSIDLEQIRGFGLPGNATELLILLALFKIRSLLDGGMRLRTACDLQVHPAYEFKAEPPVAFTLPALHELDGALPGKIAACSELFGGNNGVTSVVFSRKTKKSKKSE